MVVCGWLGFGYEGECDDMDFGGLAPESEASGVDSRMSASGLEYVVSGEEGSDIVSEVLDPKVNESNEYMESEVVVGLENDRSVEGSGAGAGAGNDGEISKAGGVSSTVSGCVAADERVSEASVPSVESSIGEGCARECLSSIKTESRGSSC